MLKRLFLSLLPFAFLVCADPAGAVPCSGKYVGQLLLQPDSNGRSMTVQAPFAYQDKSCETWQVPKGAAVDGASIPRTLWTFIGGPWDGPYRDASVIHDWYCAVRTRPWQEVHRMFYEAMLTSGVGPKLAHLMYLAVYYGGPRWDDLTIRNSKLGNLDKHLSASVFQSLKSVHGALAVGNIAGANSALVTAQGAMKTNGDQYAVSDATRAISIALNDKTTEGWALDGMISSGVPDAATLSALYGERATIAYGQGDKVVATKNARAALTLGERPDAVDVIANLKRNGDATVESNASGTFEPNALEFKRLANIVEQQNLDADGIEKLVDQVRPK